MSGPYTNPNLVTGLDYDDAINQQFANTSDYLQGIENGQAYFTNQDVADLSVCCECECNCDIFSDRMVSRTGASDPSNIEFDRKNERIWTKTGSVTLSSKLAAFLPSNVPPFSPANRACAIFSGDASLKCMTPPVDSRNFSVGFMFRFENNVAGQTITIRYGTFVGTFVVNDPDTSHGPYNTYNIVSVADVYTGTGPVTDYRGFLEGSLNGTDIKVRSAYHDENSFFSGVLSVKDGRASLLLGLGESLAGSVSIAPTVWNLWTPGVTQTSASSVLPDFVTLETSNLAGELYLFGFHLSNIENSTHHQICQGHLYGTERTCSDNYPANTYQLDFNLKLIGTTTSGSSDFQVIETLVFTLVINNGIVSRQGAALVGVPGGQLVSWSSRGTPDSPLRASVSRNPPNTPFYEFTSCYAFLIFANTGSIPGGNLWPLPSATYEHKLSLINFFTPGYAESGSPGYTFYGNWKINFEDEGPVTDPVRAYSSRRYRMSGAVGTGYSDFTHSFYNFDPFFPGFNVHQHSGMYVRGIGTYPGGPYSYCDVTAL